MKRIIMNILFVLFGLNLIFWLHLFCSGRYKPTELKYLGSADGTGGIPSYIMEQEQNYLYCGFGYGIYDPEIIDSYSLHNFDFNLELQESKKYVFSYGVPLERLEYCDSLCTTARNYYNRATFSKNIDYLGKVFC